MNRRVAILLALLAALAPALAAGAADAATPPGWALGAAPREFVLDNGLAVVLQRDEAAPITVVQLLVRCGDRDEPTGLAGLAYLTARLCLEITDGSTLRRLMDMGSSFSLEVGGGQTQFTLRCLSRDLEPTLDVLTAMLREPLFSDLRIDGVKGWMGQMQDAEADEPVVFMRKAAAAAFYAAPAYGAARFGDAASLARIGRRDIQSFHRSRYLAGNMVAVVISDLAGEELQPLLARQLGKLPPGTAPAALPAVPRRPQPAERLVERRTAQTLVSFTMALPELSADSFVMASLFESWLGKGIASRLWPLRSRHGLAYGLGADVQPNREAMLLSAFLKTEAGRADNARAELARLLQAAGSQGIGAAELAAAKAYAKSSFLRENEAREPRAALMAFLAANGLSWRLAGEIPGRLEQVGLEEFNAMVRAALDPERWFSLRIGPSAEEANFSNK